MKKGVVQKDLTGNVIASYESYANAASVLGCNESTVRKSAKFNKVVFGKFKFADTTFDIQDEKKVEVDIPQSPRILILDIETAPLLAFVYQKEVWKARIRPDKVVSDWFVLTWAAKFLDGDVVYSDKLTPDEALDEDDSRIMGSLWYLLDEAEIVIAHNGDNFDIPNINTRLIINGYPPTTPYRSIDTLKVAQQQFGFTFNSLNELAKKFGVEEKIKTDFELWKGCIRGNESSLEEMETYNIQDVLVLEDVYRAFRPWIKSHPNINMYKETTSCPLCGGTHVDEIENKFFYTQASKFVLYRCASCTGVFRGKKALITKKEVSVIPR